jgi:glutamyl-tRNA reductase
VKIALAGVSHHTASIELRERVAIDPEAAAAFARELARNGDDRVEAVVLSTCNRTELYVASTDQGAGEIADSALRALAGGHADALAPVAYRLSDDSAALHLFRVAAGLDSLVPGEGEILGQVRDAYERGAPGPLLDRTFRMALHAGRRARLETAIGESPSSVPAAAAALAQQVFEGLEGRRVLLVGAGRTSELTARNLRSRGATVTAVANRTLEHAARLAEELGARALPLEDVELALAEADVVVSSTSRSPVTSTPRWPRSTGASSTTSTTSRRSYRRLSRAGARRRCTRSASWRRRRSDSAHGRRPWPSFRR